MLLKLTNIRSSNFSAPLQIKISTRPERKKERVKERNEDLKKDKNIDDHEIDDDDKARELNYDLEINIYFDNAFEKRSTAPKWNGKTWEAFDHKKHGYNYYANDKDIQGWDRTNGISRQIFGQKVIPGKRMESLQSFRQTII